MKQIYFNELNSLQLTLAKLYKLNNFKIHYRQLPLSLRDNDSVRYFSSIDFKIMESFSVDKYTVGLFDNQFQYAQYVKSQFDSQQIRKLLNELYHLDDKALNKSNVAITKYLMADFATEAEFLAIIDERLKTNPELKIIYPATGFKKKFFKEKYPKNYSKINFPITLLLLMINAVKNCFKLAANKLIKRKSKKKPISSAKSEMAHVKQLEDHSVIFFPHQGVYYGDMYTKDQFYSDQVSSPFHMSRIYHLSINNSDLPPQQGLEYYQRNHISHGVLSSLYKVNKKNFLKKVVLELLVKRRLVGPKLSLMTNLCYQLENYLGQLRKLNKPKIALIGYDLLFPPMLSVSLDLAGIKTVATQERLLATMFKPYAPIVDYYFTQIKNLEEEFNKNPEVNWVSHYIPVGPTRIDQIFQYSSSLLSDYAKSLVKLKSKGHLILVMPYHGTSTTYMDAFSHSNNWIYIRDFYESIIKLSQEFKEAHFIIKCKDLTVLKNQNMADIADRIEVEPNIEFVKDTKSLDPSKLIAACDAGIAMHTSMGDELLACEKDIIFYDFMGLPSHFYQYDQLPVIAEDYNKLRLMFKDMLTGNLFSDTHKVTRKSLFCDSFNGQQRNRVQEHLALIYQNNC